jgi:hypothetical protein
VLAYECGLVRPGPRWSDHPPIGVAGTVTRARLQRVAA